MNAGECLKLQHGTDRAVSKRLDSVAGVLPAPAGSKEFAKLSSSPVAAACVPWCQQSGAAVFKRRSMCTAAFGVRTEALRRQRVTGCEPPLDASTSRTHRQTRMSAGLSQPPTRSCVISVWLLLVPGLPPMRWVFAAIEFSPGNYFVHY